MTPRRVHIEEIVLDLPRERTRLLDHLSTELSAAGVPRPSEVASEILARLPRGEGR